MNFPETALEGGCRLSQYEILVMSTAYLTLFRALETDKELLPVRYVNDLCLR